VSVVVSLLLFECLETDFAIRGALTRVLEHLELTLLVALVHLPPMYHIEMLSEHRVRYGRAVAVHWAHHRVATCIRSMFYLGRVTKKVMTTTLNQTGLWNLTHPTGIRKLQ